MQTLHFNPINLNPIENRFTERLFVPPSNPQILEKPKLAIETDPITGEEWFYITRSIEDLKRGRYLISEPDESPEELLRKLKI